MDLTTVAHNTNDVNEIHADDSTIYLFGSELYCGWCLESFTCPVRLKIHCHVEHFTTCSCGERYRDKETLCKHIARSTCHLPSPFKWSHFVKLPSSEVNEVCSSNTVDALEQWHDTLVDNSDKPQLNEDISDKKSADNAVGGQRKKLHSAEVDKSNNSVCNGDMLINISEHSSVNSECNINDTFVASSVVCRPDNKMKHKFTLDECKLTASVKIVAMPLHAKMLPTTSISKPVKTASSDVVVSMPLITHKCKFCHIVLSTQRNRQRHEAICRHVLQNIKSKNVTVRKIDGENIFYCSFCGFSDSDQQVLNAHVTKPHVANARLRTKSQSGHDYIGSMRLTPGNFRCTLCGLHQNSRLTMLQHLRQHSSPAALTKGMHTTHPEYTAVKMKEGTKKRSSRFYSSSCSRSCPKCFHSFASVAKYLSHRAVCRTIQRRQRVKRRGSVRK